MYFVYTVYTAWGNISFTKFLFKGNIVVCVCMCLNHRKYRNETKYEGAVWVFYTRQCLGE